MKYIQLKKPQGKLHPYDTIIHYGCGPNFVLNRQNEFEKMIKDQGITFWFRFWLKFCLYPEFEVLKEVEKELPHRRCYANVAIYRQFFQCSLDESINYCLFSALVKLKPSDKNLHDFVVKNKDNFDDLLMEYSEMAFAVYLCVVFYKWLIAKKADENCQNYWTIPKEYLDPNFKPGLLEKYLSHVCHGQLPQLLGAEASQLPWLNDVDKPGDILEETITCPQFERQMLSLMIKERSQWRSELEEQDELLYIVDNLKKINLAKDGTAYPQFLPPSVGIEKAKSNGFCAYCNRPGNKYNNFKPCKQCVHERWKHIRCYCSDSCQMEHWFQWHCKEHTQFVEEGNGWNFRPNDDLTSVTASS